MPKIPPDHLSAIHKAFPDVMTQDIQVFDDGWDHIVYVVHGSRSFRFPRRKEYAETLQREASFLGQFSAQSPVRVPKLTLDQTLTGDPYVTYPFIPGTPFTKDLSQTYTKEDLQNIARQIGGFLSALHSFPVEDAKRLGFDEQNAIDHWSARFKQIQQIVYPLLSSNERDWVTLLFTNFLAVLKEDSFVSKMTHMDMMPEHILINPKTRKLSGIIDFGDAGIRDPAYDFTFLQQYGQDFLNLVYDEYTLGYDELFEKRRQFYQDRLCVTDLEHSIGRKNKEKIVLHKNKLVDYVREIPNKN